MLLENDIEPSNIEVDGSNIYVYLEPGTNNQAEEVLRQAGINDFNLNELSMVPESYVSLDEADLIAFEKLIDALEDLDDVQQVFHNVENC
jgi:transcriptional/translational regulatory protein YebC/TACO1